MSLQVYFDKSEVPNDLDVVRFVDKEFAMLKILPTEINKQLISEIDKGTYNDTMSFIDRFGFKLSFDYISTGCKAALCAANSEKVIDLLECCSNARDAIVLNCKSGNVIFHYRDAMLSGMPEDKIDVQSRGRHFSTVQEFNSFIEEELQ